MNIRMTARSPEVRLAQHPALDRSQQMLRKKYKNRASICLHASQNTLSSPGELGLGSSLRCRHHLCV